jgi:AcrR family transcriptional regulator
VPARRPAPALRADAARNRARVLDVAQRVFASEGLAVPIDEIARRAGLGVGTVYRHFPTKEALFAAIVQEKIERLAEYVEEAAGLPAPGDALVAVLDRMVADGAHKKDLVDALGGAAVDVRSAAREASDRLRVALAALLRRAQAAGDVRRGITAEDLLALVAGTLLAAARTGGSPVRLFAVVRDGLRVR